jgi:8-oxo-dGTP diphosphatase
MTIQSRPIVEVAVGILIKEHSLVLMGKRPGGKPYADYWEFPGGKLEANESIITALKRELLEELGIQIALDEKHCHEIMTLEHDYPHAYVRLHVCLVDRWEGEPVGLENQELSWQNIVNPDLTITPLLPAAWPMIEKVRLYLSST